MHWNTTVESIVQQTLDTKNQTQIQETTIEEIITIIKALSNKKATGPDKRTVQSIKNLPIKHIQTIANIKNAILQQHYFPTQWKSAHIFVLPKPQKPKKPNAELPPHQPPIHIRKDYRKGDQKNNNRNNKRTKHFA